MNQQNKQTEKINLEIYLWNSDRVVKRKFETYTDMQRYLRYGFYEEFPESRISFYSVL